MSKIKDVLQTSKIRNILIVLVAVVVVISLVSMYFFRSGEASEKGKAKVPKVPTRISSSPASQKFSEEYLKVLLKSGEQDVERAKETGSSTVPTLLMQQGQRVGGEAYAANEEFSNPELKECVDQCRENLIEKSSSALLNSWAETGKVSPVVAARLSTLHDKDATVESYAAELNRLVREGKLTPEQAKQLLERYRQEHGKTDLCLDLNEVIDQMLSQGDLLLETGEEIRQVGAQKVSTDMFKNRLDHMVTEGKITQAQENALTSGYKRTVSGECVMVDMATKQLEDVRSGKMSLEDYAAQLDKLVKGGKITQAQADALVKQYETGAGGATGAAQTSAGTATATTKAGGATELERLLQEQQTKRTQAEQVASAKAKEVAKAQVVAQQAAARDKDIQAIASAMSSQSQALFTAWAPVKQNFTQGTIKVDRSGTPMSASSSSAAEGGSAQTAEAYPIIKAGDILFAVLDTAVNSDRPGPVMATLVAGKFKGARLLGKMTQSQDGDRVMLEFHMMTMPEWAHSVKIQAVAMNPDDARTAIASSVDHHYLLRYSALFASSFLSGYSKAVMTSGSSTTSDAIADLGIQKETHPELSPKEKIMVGIGEIGTKLSEKAGNYFDKKPTVRVDAGVGLGILFTNNVTETMPVEKSESASS